MDTKAVGRRTKLRRQQLDITQAEVARLLGTLGVRQDTSSISRLERDRGGDDIGHDLLRGLAHALNVSIDWLVEGDTPDFTRGVEQLGASTTVQRALARIGAWYSVASNSDRLTFETMMADLAESLNAPKGGGGGGVVDDRDRVITNALIRCCEDAMSEVMNRAS